MFRTFTAKWSRGMDECNLHIVAGYELFKNDLVAVLFDQNDNKYNLIAKKGLASALKEYYEASANADKVLILKSIIDSVPFIELKRFAKNGCRLFAMCQSETDLPSSDEFPGNLSLARKLMSNGYDVYMLGNPNGIRSADFIVTKKGLIYYLEGKTMNGKGSLDELLEKATSQSNNIIVDIIGTDNAAYIAKEIRNTFERHKLLKEISVFKGNRLIKTTRRHISSSNFEREFIKIWVGK